MEIERCLGHYGIPQKEQLIQTDRVQGHFLEEVISRLTLRDSGQKREKIEFQAEVSESAQERAKKQVTFGYWSTDGEAENNK